MLWFSPEGCGLPARCWGLVLNCYNPACLLVQEMNLGRMSDGLQLHQRLLQGVKEKVDCSGDLTPLLAEISELNTHIKKVGFIQWWYWPPTCEELHFLMGCDLVGVVLVVVFRCRCWLVFLLPRLHPAPSLSCLISVKMIIS